MHSSNFSLARAKALVKRRFPKSYEVVKDQLPRTRRRKAALQQRSTQDVFWEIYSGNLWGSAESKSGLGSELAATQEVRALLPRLLAELGVDVLLDVPCGDFNWMRHVDLPVREYIGGDIVPPLIDSLRASFRLNIDALSCSTFCAINYRTQMRFCVVIFFYTCRSATSRRSWRISGCHPAST